MEKVTEKEIVERINKEFDMMNKSEVQIDWDRELTFALYLIVKFGRILKKSYEEMLETFIGNKVRDCQKQLNLTDDEVKGKYERMKKLENKIEQTQSLLFEARALIKTCALATDSCITDKELQLWRQEEVFVLLKKVNSILASIETLWDS